MSEQKASVCRLVHYVGAAGDTGECRAAMVYRMGMQDEGVYLTVFDAGGVHTMWDEIFYNDAHAPNSWHWPERV